MSRSDNKLLAALPAQDYQRIRPHLRTLQLTAETPLPDCGHTRVYFPLTGLCSLINKMADGAAIEVACIGNEGVVGHTLAAWAQEQNGFLQVGDGRVEYMPSIEFAREVARNGALRDMVDRFSNTLLTTMVQVVACNRLHTAEQRCCRWLLGVHDRLGRSHFELKTRFLAHAVGLKHREATLILRALAEDGLLRHDGTSITVLDTVGLRRRSCRCYDQIKRSYVQEAAPRRSSAVERTATILRMPRGIGTCTLCGSTLRLPHKDTHQCILALDEEVAALIRRAHTLRKHRAQLLQDRLQVFSNVIKRWNTRRV